MKILAIDTSTEACSAALSVEGEIMDRYQLAPRQQAELILPMVEELLVEAGLRLSDLDGLAFGRGPGAFTGVRVAAGVIQGLAFAADLPVVPVSTLAVLAQGALSSSNKIFSAIDARMGEIYWGCYQSGADNIAALIGTERVSKPEEILNPTGNGWFGAGSGWRTYRDILTAKFSNQLTSFDGERYPHAEDIIPLAIKDFKKGKTVPAEHALPVYLRNNVTG